MAKPMKVTKKQLTEMKRKISSLYNEELEIREEIRSIYNQFMLDVGDELLAQRYVRIAYFEIQKERSHKLLKDRLEFHPFFTSGPEYSELDEDDEEEDGGLN